MDFTGKVAVVTGGGTGLGQAISRLLAEHGGDVAVVYSRSQEDAEATGRELSSLGRTATTHRIDVADEAGVAAGFEEIVRVHGGIDYLVNNAGTTAYVPFEDVDGLTGELWDRILGVNVKGAFFCARAAARSMKRRGGGAIVNITSVAAYRPTGSSLAYSVSKAALAHLTRGLAVALAPDVRVNAVAPGGMYTRWWSTRRTPEEWATGAEKLLLKRYAPLEDIALTALQLLANPSVTGQALVMDGGQLMPT
ncbi:MAG TPA: SDR family oxidoreductase [Chloroflexota bacterium]|jgi:3-oxoacyl-[acyl-carrier protein] reductase|nr:SDR family oxidoreductase [Chloroflexota bacterium]